MRRYLCLFACAALLLVLVPGSALANHTSRHRELEAEKAQLRAKIRLADQQAKTLTTQISQSDKRRASLEREISSLNAQLAGAERRLQQAELTLGEARDELLSFEDSLSLAAGRLDALKVRHELKAKEIYKNGPGTYLELLVSSKSLRDLMAKLVFVRNVFEEDRDRLTAVESLTQQLSDARGAAAQHKADIEAQKAAIESEKINISNLRSSVGGKRQQVVNEISNRQQMLGQVKAERAEYLRQMAKLEAESRSISRLLKARQAGQVFAGSGRRLAWPTTGRVTSGFGYRTHPIFGDRRFHTGIDIGAPTGQAIISSDPGEVVMVGVRSGYGLTVIVDHGGAFATLYAHMSSTSVSVGQGVARGTRLGGIGCTGYCTGPHLHFETRINGDPVDPMQFF